MSCGDVGEAEFQAGYKVEGIGCRRIRSEEVQVEGSSDMADKR